MIWLNGELRSSSLWRETHFGARHTWARAHLGASSLGRGTLWRKLIWARAHFGASNLIHQNLKCVKIPFLSFLWYVAPFVRSEGTNLIERFPAQVTVVGPLAGMYSFVDLQITNCAEVGKNAEVPPPPT